jgi:replicative DNA helicase
MTVLPVNGHAPAAPDDDLRSLPPHDIEAERGALGAMMRSADALAACLALLNADAFLRPAHQVIHGALAALAADGEPADWLTVKGQLERQDALTQAGGWMYLSDLADKVPDASHGVYYARRLLDVQSQRDTARLGTRVQQVAADPTLTPRERLDLISEELDKLADTGPQTETATAADLIGPLVEALEAGPSTVPGITTPWAEFNRLVPGFRPGEVTVVGGRPGMGKSVVLLNVAAHAAIRLGQQVLAVTLEMSREEYMERLLAAEAGVELTHIRRREVSDYDWDRIAKVRETIADATTLRIHEGPDLSPQGIRAEMRAMRRAGKPAQLVTIDYLQLMESPGRSESRQQEVSGISRSIKLIAKEFGVPVLVGSQLNRGPDLRSDHRPVKADLRESGAVEQDADIVVLLYRDDAYVKESPSAGEIELILAKNRQGTEAVATLAFRGGYASCDDLYREPEPWTPTSVLERNP